jgi:TPR repeat protein
LSGKRARASAKVHWARPLEREATRRAIIDAARCLAAKQGDGLTLSAVAAEVGFSRATIYGYFAGKQDLLAAIAGDAGSDREPKLEVIDKAAADSNPEPGQSLSAAEPEPVVRSATADSILSTPAPVDAPEIEKDEPATRTADKAAPAAESRHWQAVQIEKIAKALVLPEGAAKEGTDAALAKLTARARALEQTINDVAKQQTSATADLAEKRKADQEALQALQANFHTAQTRQQVAFSEVHFSIHNLATRLDEIGHKLRAPEDAAKPDAVSFVPAIAAKPADSDDARQSAEASDDASQTFISAARRLARDGARAAEELEIRTSAKHKRRRRSYAIAIAAALLVTCVSIYVSLRSDLAGEAVSESVPTEKLAAAPVKKLVPPVERIAVLASKGNAQAELVMGAKLLRGDGVAANPTQAAHWLERAADQGEPVAQDFLGTLYQSGRGVARNPALAMRWLEASALQGNVRAAGELASGYANGLNGTADFAEAARWFSRAANFGEVDAEFNLGVLFERGDGVPQSTFDAYKWYAIAARQGDKGAAARADMLASQLSRSQLRAAQQAVAAFIPISENSAANDMPAATALVH